PRVGSVPFMRCPGLLDQYKQAWYLTPQRRLDMGKLLDSFQQFFRENADVWLQGLPYREAGPHLILQAFLQRIVNGGGRIHREYALGRKRTDLYLEWPLDEARGFAGEVQRVVIELKVLYANLDKTIADGVAQASEYARQCGADEVHLVIFNRDPAIGWDEKIWHQVRADASGMRVDAWGA
ncbi:ATP-binding protein, partial [Candidatus Thiothrix sp. Deng01]|nr:ATP-binding protein [Candidatus Thiothrix sp. Deng01]